MTRELWSPGEFAWFEYHCLESDTSSDAELWHRSHARVTVLGRADCEPVAWDESTAQERGENGTPRMYQIQFEDGHNSEVFEDELSESQDAWYRPDPPQRDDPTR